MDKLQSLQTLKKFKREKSYMQLEPLQISFKRVEVEKADEVIKWVFPNASYYHDNGEYVSVFIETNQESNDWCYTSNGVKYKTEFSEDYKTLQRKFLERKNSNEQLSLF